MDIPDSGGRWLNELMSTRPPCVRCNAPLSGMIYLVENLNKLDNGDPDMVFQTECESCGKVQILWKW